MKLIELYNLKLLDYKINGVKEKPDKLLAMLLLPEKDNLKPLLAREDIFYITYKTKINEKIKKAIRDFEITDDEIIKYIEDKGVLCDDFKHDKVWLVFGEVFGSMHWGLMYYQEKSPEQIYAEVFGVNDLENTNEFQIKYRKLYEVCSKYPTIQLTNRQKPFDVKNDWEKAAENGFIEKYCLSDEEVVQLKTLRKQNKNKQ